MSSQVDRASVVLVTRTLSLRCDSGALLSDPAGSQIRSLAEDGQQRSVSSGVAAGAATSCSALSKTAACSADAVFGSSPDYAPSPLAASPHGSPSQLSFLDWNAALQRCSGISNPLARPPLPLAGTGGRNADDCTAQRAASR